MNGDYAACLKYSVRIFVEQVFKMQRLEVRCAVQPIYGSLGAKGLMPELNPSVQHCLLRFFTGDFNF
jgi:hypothetical protein